MKNKMYVPETCHVGFNTRKDTYTGKLGYIIYTDEKGKMRKETSWQNWRNKSIEQVDFKNEPTEGFVLNRNGGGRGHYSWDSRNAFIRVYDPRDFEFEISVENLLFILQHCTSTKGKGLEGKFVYAWSGTDLVLLPEGCEEYKTCMDFTSAKSKKVTKKDMVVGATYRDKELEQCIYLGRMECRDESPYWRDVDVSKPLDKKKHVFFYPDRMNKETYDRISGRNKPAKIKDCLEFKGGFTHLSEIIDNTCHEDFADIHAEALKHYRFGNFEKVEKTGVSLAGKNGVGNYCSPFQRPDRTHYGSNREDSLFVFEVDGKTHLSRLIHPSYISWASRSNPTKIDKEDWPEEEDFFFKTSIVLEGDYPTEEEVKRFIDYKVIATVEGAYRNHYGYGRDYTNNIHAISGITQKEFEKRYPGVKPKVFRRVSDTDGKFLDKKFNWLG